MVVFEVAEGLIIKEHAKAAYWVELFDHHKSVVAWTGSGRTVLDRLSKPSCEYTWNELKDYLKRIVDNPITPPARRKDW